MIFKRQSRQSVLFTCENTPIKVIILTLIIIVVLGFQPNILSLAFIFSVF